MEKRVDLGFATVPSELAVERLPLHGQLPGWLSGTLLRNGPGTFRAGTQQVRHWFDGMAMLHRFSFGDGQVGYANRFLATRAYTESRSTGRLEYAEFATDPPRTLVDRVTKKMTRAPSDNAKMGVARIGQKYVALSETAIQIELDPQTLSATARFAYEAPADTGSVTTSHPLVDLAKDEVYNLVVRYDRVSHYRLYRIRGGGKPQLLGELPTPEPAYVHSFAMTETYLVLVECPLVVKPVSLTQWMRPYIENFRWKPQRGSAFHVLDRHTGQLVARFDSDAFFAFHQVNAFQAGDELRVDLVAYPDTDVIQAYYLDQITSPQAEIPQGALRRYRLPLKRRNERAGFEPLGDTGVELPRFDERRFARTSYRHVYGVGHRPEQLTGMYNQLVKVDTQRGQHVAWHAPGCYPGEPVFVDAPGGSAEDNGVVLSLVLDAAHGHSFLLVLDAQSFAERARATLPHAAVHGFHGAFFPT
jgi:beta,beta-carotene 9',10'-dioxygenase